MCGSTDDLGEDPFFICFRSQLDSHLSGVVPVGTGGIYAQNPEGPALSSRKSSVPHDRAGGLLGQGWGESSSWIAVLVLGRFSWPQVRVPGRGLFEERPEIS